MTDQWAENLRYLHKYWHDHLVTGDGDQTPTVLSMPDGVKVVQTEYGPDFHCETCNAPAALL